MKVFDHVGVPTNKKQKGERFVAKTKVFVTDPKKHPFKVEFLRYAEDSSVTGDLRNSMHIAYRVDSIDKESAGLEVMIEPFYSVAGHFVGFFKTADSIVIELMEYDD